MSGVIHVDPPEGERPSAFGPPPRPSHHDHSWMPVGNPYARQAKPPSTLFVVQMCACGIVREADVPRPFLAPEVTER